MVNLMNVYKNREQDFIDWLKQEIIKMDQIIIEAQNKKIELLEKLKEQEVDS
jgi:hypothetical protein